MKYLRLAAVLSLAALGIARAQDDSSQGQKPQEEIPDFSNLDEYIYVPKTTVSLGMRYLSGTKASFAGTGKIPAPSSDMIGDSTTPNIDRTYHDGSVGTDTRTVTVANGDGTTSQVPVTDGKTSTWGYQTQNQITPEGLMTLSSYSAQTTDPLTHSISGRGSVGMELSVSRDMGDISKKLSWKLFGGMSLSQIDAGQTSTVRASVTTVTDTYDLFGQTPPAAPYTGPTTTSSSVVDVNGNQLTDAQGNAESQNVDTSTLLGNVPLNRNQNNATLDALTTVSNTWKIHGGYYTFRGGPSLVYSFNDHLKLSVSAGPAIIFAGSNYTVDQVLDTATGDPLDQPVSDNESKLLLGYYADATLQYNLTDTTGFYVGSYYQDAGKYKQTITNPDGNYTTTVDLTNQNGIRTGMTFKF